MSVDPELSAVLACPKCRGGLGFVRKSGGPGDFAPVEEANRAEGLACGACKLVYRIEDGIPVLLPEEASPLTLRE